jgi:hypothetical protein
MSRLPSLLHYIFCLSIVQKSNYFFFPLSLCTSPIRFDVNLLLWSHTVQVFAEVRCAHWSGVGPQRSGQISRRQRGQYHQWSGKRDFLSQSHLGSKSAIYWPRFFFFFLFFLIRWLVSQPLPPPLPVHHGALWSAVFR